MLTEEQKKIAEENHNLIYFFLRYFNVGINDYYDIFAITYINCIKVWNKEQATLSALLTSAFLNAIKSEQRKNKIERNISFISLNNFVYKDTYIRDIIPDIQTNIEKKVELTEDIAFFNKYIETNLLMQGFSIDEIALKTNSSKEKIRKNIKNIKILYRKEMIKQ